ncbi:MAG: hypothetical protein H6722_33325 [Sandaracinus sp.]|nr:hypothetical protein [Sandaracinus sp.]
MTLAVLLSGVVDPMTALMGLQSTLRNAAARQRETEIGSEALRGETEFNDRMEQLEKAAKAAAKAAKTRPWLRKLIGAIVTAIGAVASIFGGAGAGLVAVGVILIAAGDILSTLVEKGIIQGERAQKIVAITAAVLKIAGAIVMAVASGGSSLGEVANAATTIASVAGQVASHIQTTASVYAAHVDVHNGVREFQAEQFRVRADEHGIASEEASENMEEATDALKQLLRRFQRVVAQLRATAEVREQASRALVGALA